MHSKEREDFEAGLAGFLATLHTGSTHTQQAYERDIRRFIQFLVERQVPELRSVDIHCVREYVAARHRQGASGASLSRALSALRSGLPISAREIWLTPTRHSTFGRRKANVDCHALWTLTRWPACWNNLLKIFWRYGIEQCGRSFTRRV